MLRTTFAALRFAFRWSRRFTLLIVILAMLAINIGTLVFAPLAAAAGSMLARAGITTVVEARESRIAKQADDLARARATAARQADELGDLRAAASRQADELARVRNMAVGQADELARVRNRAVGQADELARVRAAMARQSEELASVRLVRYRGQTRTLREAVSDTADRVARRTANATVRNLAAIPAEAVPLFGIAVIAGATAWELRDSCALMKDIHELNVAFNPSLANDPERYEACGLEVPTRAEIWQQMVKDPAAVLSEQPEDYGPLPDFDEPGWWDWAMSWFAGEPELASVETRDELMTP